MTYLIFGVDVTKSLADLVNATLLAPAAVIPSLGIAVLTYLLVTRQLAMIQDEVSEGEEFGTSGEANEWLGGPTSEWLGI